MQRLPGGKVWSVHVKNNKEGGRTGTGMGEEAHGSRCGARGKLGNKAVTKGFQVTADFFLSIYLF